VAFGGGELRLSHSFEAGSWYAKPMVEGGATYMSYGDITETGAGVANLIVDGENQWVLNAGASVEFGARMVIQDRLLVRPSVRVGVIALSESEFSLTSRFAGAPAGVGDFTVTTAYDDVLADIGAGLDLYAIDAGLSVTLGYDGKLGESTAAHAGSAKLRMMF
jgi:hypothetical protein